MEPATYSGNPSVNYHISSHNKQPDICQEKLHEEHEQKKLSRNDNVVTIGNIGIISKQLQQQEDSTLCAEEKNCMKNTLWRRMGPSVGRVGKGNNLVSPKTLKCSVYQKKDIDSEKNPKINPSYINRIVHKRRKLRQIRHVDNNSFLNHIRRLPRQNTTDPYEVQFFHGSNFY
ncbi:uncharacterized protein OCT59_026515 [Rhizophagus irregularis]|uniref:Uncharacterized protein n=3 Tax=Rhizophagus irregularis TaxID=588596 RepID=A0A2I1F401_9GLOM|nr:hypothetical protein GLOIN_2v1869072 [Rhizophagus irregularis DAOM 181602=DAOM 197198]PKY29102.1 hypothetical protein RhiirB3_482738 [Rhizophagus irregularis]POG80439.1 hypothetical protein GLOIN_2v1869072 [Rhizophagus irregularis DAOM 181602=DAOM 197198]UZO06184.1 hypothetical protein OCT59_026515 [Rhizophagus irregularis]CAB5365408.1 unnamed protein product [Rhizophagus irregularis]|eukprot:XP_025187305.1 hypothetical protein GLOIN_2v1869072 [Rhizophagus irregularis DAOM 181602=DAOM 197198]